MDQQAMPPSQPKPGMTGAAPNPASSGAARGQKGASRSQADPAAVQKEMTRGLQGLSEALYSNEKTSAAVLKMVTPEDKIGSAAKAAMFTVSQIMEKGQLAERIAVPLIVVAADEIMQMAEAAGNPYSEDDAKNVTMAAAEMMLSAYGVDPARAQAMAEQASPEDRAEMESVYKPVAEKSA